MKISPIDPIAPAWNHMLRILFTPFDVYKWLLLGSCAFLGQCGQGGRPSSISDIGQLWRGSSKTTINQTNVLMNDELTAFLSTIWQDHLGIIIFGGGAIALGVIALLLFITWISSRGKFMLLDGIVKNRGAISEPWSEYKTQGNSLFFCRTILQVVSFIILLCVATIAAVATFPDIQSGNFENIKSGNFENITIAGAVIGGSAFLFYILIMIGINFFLYCFVVPTMFIQKIKVMEAVPLVWNKLCKGNVASAISLFAMIAIFSIVATMIMLTATCCNCCIVALPYINAIVFLPITVFFACYALCYIEQLGPEWKIFTEWCPSCGYNLSGLDESTKCPECGFQDKKRG